MLQKTTTGQIQSQASGGVMSFGVALRSASSAVRMAMHALNRAHEVTGRRR